MDAPQRITRVPGRPRAEERHQEAVRVVRLRRPDADQVAKHGAVQARHHQHRDRREADDAQPGGHALHEADEDVPVAGSERAQRHRGGDEHGQADDARGHDVEGIVIRHHGRHGGEGDQAGGGRAQDGEHRKRRAMTVRHGQEREDRGEELRARIGDDGAPDAEPRNQQRRAGDVQDGADPRRVQGPATIADGAQRRPRHLAHDTH